MIWKQIIQIQFKSRLTRPNYIIHGCDAKLFGNVFQSKKNSE